MRIRLVSALLLAVIDAALCFSAGEGLRLTPFPHVPEPEQMFALKPANEISQSQYGPLNVPVQTQKRSKRQAVEVAVPASPGIHAAAASRFSLVEAEATDRASILFVARPSGRAPPALS